MWFGLTALETISRWHLLKKRKTRSLSHPFGHSGITYALHLWLVGKPMVDAIRRNWTFSTISYSWDVMSGNRSKMAFFDGGWVTLSADFRGKRASPTNHCWCQKTRVIAVSCGIKIFTVRCLVLSQYTHLTNGWTDKIATAIPCIALHAVAR